MDSSSEDTSSQGTPSQDVQHQVAPSEDTLSQNTQPQHAVPFGHQVMASAYTILHDGRVRRHNVTGQLELREPDGYVPAVYHNQIAGQLLTRADQAGTYVHPRPAGNANLPNDRTAYHSSYHGYSDDRGNWPPILDQFESTEEDQNRRVTAPFIKWKMNGQMVINDEGYALRKIAELPVVISSNPGIAFVEAYKRSHLGIVAKDIRDRMVTDFDFKRFGDRLRRWREDNGLISWEILKQQDPTLRRREYLRNRMGLMRVHFNTTGAIQALGLSPLPALNIDERRAIHGLGGNRWSPVTSKAKVERESWDELHLPDNSYRTAMYFFSQIADPSVTRGLAPGGTLQTQISAFSNSVHNSLEPLETYRKSNGLRAYRTKQIQRTSRSASPPRTSSQNRAADAFSSTPRPDWLQNSLSAEQSTSAGIGSQQIRRGILNPYFAGQFTSYDGVSDTDNPFDRLRRGLDDSTQSGPRSPAYTAQSQRGFGAQQQQGYQGYPPRSGNEFSPLGATSDNSAQETYFGRDAEQRAMDGARSALNLERMFPPVPTQNDRSGPAQARGIASPDTASTMRGQPSQLHYGTQRQQPWGSGMNPGSRGQQYHPLTSATLSPWSNTFNPYQSNRPSQVNRFGQSSYGTSPYQQQQTGYRHGSQASGPPRGQRSGQVFDPRVVDPALFTSANTRPVMQQTAVVPSARDPGQSPYGQEQSQRQLTPFHAPVGNPLLARAPGARDAGGSSYGQGHPQRQPHQATAPIDNPLLGRGGPRSPIEANPLLGARLDEQTYEEQVAEEEAEETPAEEQERTVDPSRLGYFRYGTEGHKKDA